MEGEVVIALSLHCPLVWGEEVAREKSCWVQEKDRGPMWASPVLFLVALSEDVRTIRSGLPAAAESAVELHQGQGFSLLRVDQIQLRGEKVGVCR